MATNYGQERLLIGHTMAGDVRVASLSVAPALQPRLRINLAWTLGHLQSSLPPGEPREYRVSRVEGELLMGPQGPVIGTLLPTGERQLLRSLPYVDEQQSHLVVDLDAYRVERIEAYRNGGQLVLKLALWPSVEMLDGKQEQARISDIRVTVPREDWLEILATVTGDQTDLLEVRYHLTFAGKWQPSLKELAAARSAVDRGDYSGAVIRARKALLLLEEALRSGGHDDARSRLAEHVDERHSKLYSTILARAKDMGNIQAHSSSAREYSRAEALFSVRLAEQLLELFGAITSGP